MTAIRKREWTTKAGVEKAAWLVDYRDSQGKRRAKQFAKKKEAEAWRVPAEFQVSQGIHTADSQSVTLREAAKLWLAYAENEGLERSTVSSYEATARLHITPILGKAKLSKITRPMIEEYRDELVRTRSRSMASRAISYLIQIINEAMRRGLIAHNPAKGVSVKQTRKEKVEIPARDELRAIINACGEKELPLILTDIFTGLRASELRGLAWTNIDFTAKTLSVTQRADLWNNIGSPKSSAGFRTIPLPDSVITALRKWKLACPPSKFDLVFPTSKGTPQSYSNLMKRVIFPLQVRAGVAVPALDKDKNPKLDEAGKPVLTGKYSLHAFRHAAASSWIDQNIDLKRLQTWMGHEKIQITIDTYGHLLKDSEKDAAIANEAEKALLS